MADRRVILPALLAARLGLEGPTKARWVQPRRPAYTSRPRYRAGGIPTEDGYAFTAEVVIDEPREPRIEPIGVFDHRGMMLCRVTIPIKCKMGFSSGRSEPVVDEVQTIVPEDMLAVTDQEGGGIASLDPSEFEAGDDDDA